MAWQCIQSLVYLYRTALDLTFKSAELMARTADTLHRQIKYGIGLCLCDVYLFQIRQDRLSGVPVHVFRFFRYVITLCGTDRDNIDILKTKALFQFMDIRLNLTETFLTVIYKIHLVYRKHKMLDSHQRADSRMTSGLHQNALLCIDQNDRKLREGGTYCHISGIFLMSRCVRNNKAALIGCKITVRNIDRDPLFTLCHQTVQKQ